MGFDLIGQAEQCFVLGNYADALRRCDEILCPVFQVKGFVLDEIAVNPAGPKRPGHKAKTPSPCRTRRRHTTTPQTCVTAHWHGWHSSHDLISTERGVPEHEEKQQDNQRDACPCVAAVALGMQALFELGHPAETVKLFLTHYFDATNFLPCQLFVMWCQLLIYKGQKEEAARAIVSYLALQKAQKSELDATKCVAPSVGVNEYADLVEMLIFHCLLPLKSHADALHFLRKNHELQSHKRMGFIRRVKLSKSYVEETVAAEDSTAQHWVDDFAVDEEVDGGQLTPRVPSTAAVPKPMSTSMSAQGQQRPMNNVPQSRTHTTAMARVWRAVGNMYASVFAFPRTVTGDRFMTGLFLFAFLYILRKTLPAVPGVHWLLAELQLALKRAMSLGGAGSPM